MGGSETTGTQVGRSLSHAYQVYMGVDVGALSIRSGGGGGFSSNRENKREKQAREQGQRVIIPRSVTNCNGVGGG